MNLSKHKLRQIFVNTEDICFNKGHKFSKTKSRVLDSSVIDYDVKSSKNRYHTAFDIVNEDSIDAGLDLMDNHECRNPLVLIMASDICPGGGVRKGARAQEECIYRRTNICLHQNSDLLNKYGLPLYPFNMSINKKLKDKRHKKEFDKLKSEVKNYKGTDVAIYTPKVTVLKDKEYKLLESFRTISFVNIAGIRNPVLENGNFKEDDENLLYMKIYQMIKIAVAYEHDSIVLGALGCGAFHNPPEIIAKIFADILEDYKVSPLKHIRFAILCRKSDESSDTDSDYDSDYSNNDSIDSNEPLESNYDVFKRVMSDDWWNSIVVEESDESKEIDNKTDEYYDDESESDIQPL